jgi:hypothetical protein
MDSKYTVVQSSGGVVERYRGKRTQPKRLDGASMRDPSLNLPQEGEVDNRLRITQPRFVHIVMRYNSRNSSDLAQFIGLRTRHLVGNGCRMADKTRHNREEGKMVYENLGDVEVGWGDPTELHSRPLGRSFRHLSK